MVMVGLKQEEEQVATFMEVTGILGVGGNAYYYYGGGGGGGGYYGGGGGI